MVTVIIYNIEWDSMGKKLETSFINKDAKAMPGPSHYQLPNVTFSSPGKSIVGKNEHQSLQNSPGPGTYNSDKPKYNDLKFT